MTDQQPQDPHSQDPSAPDTSATQAAAQNSSAQNDAAQTVLGGTPSAEHRPPASNPILKTALVWGGLLALVIAVVAGVIGGVLDGWSGVASALIGTALAVVYLGITAGSILLANRFSGSDLFVGVFFGIVLGGWIVKFVLFIVIAVVLKGQPWVNPLVMFLSLIVGVIGSLVVDVVVVLRSRMPYASDARLPGGRS
ncbi:hypothetical protein ACX9R5_15120 [Rathayibacter sp. CAU 1779]